MESISASPSVDRTATLPVGTKVSLEHYIRGVVQAAGKPKSTLLSDVVTDSQDAADFTFAAAQALRDEGITVPVEDEQELYYATLECVEKHVDATLVTLAEQIRKIFAGD